MTRESYYICAYWSARLESPAQCAERLLQLMNELADCHELMASWNQKARTLRQALRRKIVPTREALEPLFKATRPEEPTALGYMFSCWNGRQQSEEGLTLLIACGGSPSVPGIYNFVILELPLPSDSVASLYEPDVLFDSLCAIVHAWEPDWTVLFSDEYRDQHMAYDERPTGKPYIGWMTYLRQKRLGGLTASDPPPCEAVPIPDRGTIFVLTREHRFSVEHPDDIARARELTEWLEARGALIPIPSNEPF